MGSDARQDADRDAGMGVEKTSGGEMASAVYYVGYVAGDENVVSPVQFVVVTPVGAGTDTFFPAPT